MAGQVTFHNDGSSYRLRGSKAVARWVEECARREGYSCGPVAYIFCSGGSHLDINRRYLGHDYRTDVITFDYSDLSAGTVSGDIFIDPETVRDNARSYGVTAREEMLRVIIHGMLHLCGYGDKSETEAALMRAKEDEYLALLEE
ncbi:MAG: rRNA maturation RNase YbeY [Rikenellaceae bacterium]|nr:rRNA maturation RNase YbeY [Rikenellaceae bacterium]